MKQSAGRRYPCTHLETDKGALTCRRYLDAFSVPLTAWPIAFISRSIYASVNSISAFFTFFVVSIIKITWLPCVFSLAMILSILKLPFVLMSRWFKSALALEFAIDKLSLELVSTIENDFAFSRFEVILKLTVICIEALLLLFAFSFELMIFKFSLVYFFLILRQIFPLDELSIFKKACVSSSIFCKCS